MFYPLKPSRVPLYFAACTILIAGPCILALGQSLPGTAVPIPYPTTPQMATFSPIKGNTGTQTGVTVGVQSIQREQMDAVTGDIVAYERRQSSGEQAASYLSEFDRESPNRRSVHNSIDNAPESYRAALRELEGMTAPGAFSVRRAVYLVENAFFDNKLPADKFQQLLDGKLTLYRHIIQKEKLDSGDELSRHYALQKLFTDTIYRYDPTSRTTRKYRPVSYDFTDYMGQEHWENMFVSKLLATGKGQCHSMPLLYLMLAEQLGVKANLALAPEHSFIVFHNKEGKRYNFETTNGTLVSHNWLMQSGYINTSAIRNSTYLDTLNTRQLLANILMDLTLGYVRKYGFDAFAHHVLQRVKALNPDNLQALILEANLLTIQTQQAIQAAGNPPVNKLPEHPKAFRLYQQMNAAYERIDDRGYQLMPPDAYQRWRKSVEQEKKKQETKELEAQLRQQIGTLPSTKTNIHQYRQ